MRPECEDRAGKKTMSGGFCVCSALCWNRWRFTGKSAWRYPKEREWGCRSFSTDEVKNCEDFLAAAGCGKSETQVEKKKGGKPQPTDMWRSSEKRNRQPPYHWHVRGTASPSWGFCLSLALSFFPAIIQRCHFGLSLSVCSRELDFESKSQTELQRNQVQTCAGRQQPWLVHLRWEHTCRA